MSLNTGCKKDHYNSNVFISSANSSNVQKPNVIGPERYNLIFRPIELDNAKYFYKFLQGIDQFLSINAPRSLIEAERLVAHYLENISSGNEIRYVVLNPRGDFIGCVGLYNMGTNDTEIQMWVAKDFQNLGFGTEILKTFLKWIRKNIEFNIIYAAFDEKNIASQEIAKNLGGVPGNLKSKKIFQPESGKTLNIIWYEFYLKN